MMMEMVIKSHYNNDDYRDDNNDYNNDYNDDEIAL